MSEFSRDEAIEEEGWNPEWAWRYQRPDESEVIELESLRAPDLPPNLGTDESTHKK